MYSSSNLPFNTQNTKHKILIEKTWLMENVTIVKWNEKFNN